MATEKQPYSNIIDALLDRREPNWKDIGMEDARKSGEEVADWSHQYADTDFEDDIAESASRHTPIWGPKSGARIYEERIAEKEAAAPRINSVTAYRRMDEYKSEDGDNDSLMNEVTESIEKAYSSSNLAENSAAKKEVSDAQQLQKLAEIELFNHQSATDYLQRNAGLLGIAYLEPNTYMDKNSPTYEHTAVDKNIEDNPKCSKCGTKMKHSGGQYECPKCGHVRELGFRALPKSSSNVCVAQKKAWDQAGIKPQAHSVKQIAACQGCQYFGKGARSKTCNLYHLPVVANAQELSQIVNHLTPGVPEKRKHAALVVLANGDGKRVQNPKVAEQTGVVKTADAKVRNQEKRASYQFSDSRETSRRFSSEHVAKMHGKGASLEQIYKWAEEKFGSVDVSLAFRGFVQGLRKNASGRIEVASKDLSFLNSIGIRNAAFEGKERCASCEYHKKALSPILDYEESAVDIRPCANCGADQHYFTYDEHSEVFCTSCGEVQPISQQDLMAYQQSGKTSSKAGRVAAKFAESSSHVAASKQPDREAEIVVTAAKVRMLHQAGHSVERIYKSAAGKVGSVEAHRAVAGFVEDMRKRPGKVAVSENDRAFLIGKLGFRPEQVRMLDPQRRPVTQVVASVPEDANFLSYPGMGKHAGEKKATDGHAILNEFDLTGSHDMPDIDVSGPKRDDVEIGEHYKVDLD
jgi:hypothetical protein